MATTFQTSDLLYWAIPQDTQCDQVRACTTLETSFGGALCDIQKTAARETSTTLDISVL